ncbi:Palmitoyl-protein thioesterase 1 [Exophiala dermatitidis]
MLLKPLSLLSLPAAALSLVIFPEAAVFSKPHELQDSSDSYQSPCDILKALPQRPIRHVDADTTRPLPQLDDLGEAAPELRVSGRHFRVSSVEDQMVKITRLSPGSDSHQREQETSGEQPLPVVIWHGLGDSADRAGLKEVAELVNDVHPGTYTYIISVAESPGSADRQASFFGNVTSQIETVCHLLAKDNILRTAPAIDAIGFSQGGQFLRGYVQRCGNWAPKVRSLITFGSQHNGIAEFQKCNGATDWICQGANALLKSNTVWSDFIQSRLVPAQYYRDLNDYENYLKHSNFLADINNERELKNVTYAQNLAELEKFVMIVFRDDQTVIPKDSGWFDEVNMTSNSVTKLRDRPLYKEDWIGLKKLDEKGGLDFVALDGEHMQLVDKDLKRLFDTYLGPAGKRFDGTEEGRWKPEL